MPSNRRSPFSRPQQPLLGSNNSSYGPLSSRFGNAPNPAAPAAGSYEESMRRLGNRTPGQQGGQQSGQQSSQPSNMFNRGPLGAAPPDGVRAGDYLSETYARDYENLLNAQRGRSNSIGGAEAGIQQGINLGQTRIGEARAAGAEARQIGQQGLDALMQQAQLGQNVYGQAQKDVTSAYGDAKTNMQQGVGTMQGAIKEMDFNRQDALAGNINAVDGQLEAQRQQIRTDPNLNDAEKADALSNLSMQRNTMVAAQTAANDQRSAESALQAKNALGNMQMSMGQALGGLGMQGAGLTSSVGLNASQMGQQAAQAGYNLMAAQSQFASSTLQGAIDAASRDQQQGNLALAQIRLNKPLDVLNLSDTILAMMNAQGMRPGSTTSPSFGGRLGGLMGSSDFRGYAPGGQTSRFGNTGMGSRTQNAPRFT